MYCFVARCKPSLNLQNPPLGAMPRTSHMVLTSETRLEPLPGVANVSSHSPAQKQAISCLGAALTVSRKKEEKRKLRGMGQGK